MAKRRQNGEGTIYQRPNGLWVCEITLGYDTDKKRIKKTVSSMDLEKLKKKINDLKYYNDRHMIAEPSNYTVGTWIDFWLETYKKNSVKPTTYDMYYGINERYIKPNIGHYKIDKLNPIVIQQLFNNLAKESLNTKDGLSYSSLKKILLTISQSYKKAIELNMIYQNPCDKIVLPNKQKKRKAVAFTISEQQSFIDLCGNESTFHNLFKFAFNTGMRLGELLALTWQNIDFDNKMINVSLNLTVVNDYSGEKVKNKTIINTTKTDNERLIPLNSIAMEVINIQRAKNIIESPFVFFSKVGTPLIKRNIYRSFNDILAKANITNPVTFHSFRHSFATRLLERGADIKTVSVLLGHRSIQITLDIYGHVSQDLKRKTIDLLE